MPTENERKYVLFRDRKVLESIETRAKKQLHIEQHILKEGSGWVYRIRRSVPCDGPINPKFADPQYMATFKQHVNGRLVELNHEIDKRDYEDLKTKSLGQIIKTRHLLPYGLHIWEVDVFYNGPIQNDPFFIMAEVELDEGDEAPPHVPDFITDHLLYEVPIDVKGFSNKKLRNVEYAEAVYQNLLEGHKNEKEQV